MALSLRNNGMRGAIWGVLLADMGAWVVALAGVSALQYNCHNGLGVPGLSGGDAVGAACNNFYSYEWWKVSFQFIVLLGIFLSSVLGHIHINRVAMAVFLAISTLMLMDATNTFYISWLVGKGNVTIIEFFLDVVLLRTPRAYDLSLARRVSTYWVGTMLSSIFNFMLIYLLGTHDEGATVDGAGTGTGYGWRNKGAANRPVTGTTTTTGAGGTTAV